MLSQIERSEANPTFAVVWSLTRALDIDFAELVGSGSTAPGLDRIEVTSREHTPEIRSSDGGCRLQILSPPQLAGRTEWYQLEMQIGAALISEPHAPGTYEHFTALTDGFEVTSGDNRLRLQAGQTARYRADAPHSIVNVGTALATGFLILLYQ